MNGSALEVRLLDDGDRSTAHLLVQSGDGVVARVVVGRSRRELRTSGMVAPTPAPIPTAAPSAAWPAASSDRAARDRWTERHPTLATLHRIDLEAGAGHLALEVVEAVGAHLADTGTRRLDLRAAQGANVLGILRGDRWMRGDVDGAAVASLSLRYPWGRAVTWTPREGSRLPLGVQRLGRRISSFHPTQIPELSRVAATEVATTLRLRYAPGGPHVAPPPGAPPGTFPFAVTRYRTIRQAFALVPPEVRSTTLVDIGCGDGRILREALAAGFASVHGRELDPLLAARAAAALGDRGTVDVGDGLEAPLPDDAGVIYLNNPFDAHGVERLATLVGATLARRPRPLLVIYINPQTVGPLLAEGMALVQCLPAYSVLASSRC